MMTSLLGMLAQVVATTTAPVAPPMPASIPASINNQANDLFDRNAILKQWALRSFDTNRDGWLTLYEAQPALVAFKQLADGNRDGRVTTYEYDRALEFIAARK